MNGQVWALPATGGQPVALTPPSEGVTGVTWSPDNQWIAYRRGPAGKRELVKIDSTGQGSAVVLSNQGGFAVDALTRWSGAGRIAYNSLQGVRICGPDGSSDRLLAPGAMSGDFNREGNLFYALKRDGALWKLLTVGSGERPRPAQSGLTRHEARCDIWMLEGLPRPETGFMRLFRHWSTR